MGKLTPLLLWSATFIALFLIYSVNPIFALYLAMGLAFFYVAKYFKQKTK